MRFEEEGLFWQPFKYQAASRRGTRAADDTPRSLPPVPETGWVARADFPDLSAASALSVDTETFDPDLKVLGPGPRRDGKLVGISVATDDGNFCRYYPIGHTLGGNLDAEPVLRWLREQLSRPSQPKVGANLLYDLDFLAAAGIAVAGPCYDVLYADPLIYEYEASYSLDAVASRRLGEQKETSLLYQWCADAYGGEVDSAQRKNIYRAPVELVGPYAEQDARLPLRVLRAQLKELRAMGCSHIFEMECKLIPLLLEMRQRGVPIDLARANSLDCELSAAIESLQKKVSLDVFAGEQIKSFCDREGIQYPMTDPSERFPEGQASFTKDWLQEQTNPILRGVSELRRLYKLRDTFIRGSLLNKHINGVLHCEFHPLRSDDFGTVSGRFSSSHPNLQQIPIRDKVWGPRIRSCFVPPPGHRWMKNDLSQIEFRLGAHFGVGENAEQVRQRYRDDPKTDFYGIAVELTGLERDPSKSISLGTMYGMRPKKFARMTKRSLEEAEELFQQFNERMPFMKETYDFVADEASKFGFVQTIGGRICHITPGFEHKALNRKLQGSCADWIKKAMLQAYEEGLFRVLPLFLTVHDELDNGLPEGAEGLDAAKRLRVVMESAYAMSIPARSDCAVGASWGEAKKVNW